MIRQRLLLSPVGNAKLAALRCSRINSMATLLAYAMKIEFIMSQIVYVKSFDGRILHPTMRCGHVRWLLKNNKAKVISSKPFQIQLLYKEKEIYHSQRDKRYILGIDPGRQNIGLSVIDRSGQEYYSGKVITRNKEIPCLMKDRAINRSQRRQHHRQMRRRRAIKCGTTTTFPNGRIIPGCDKPIYPKDIVNSEARFLNRKRPHGWITPTVRHLVQTHINIFKKIQKLLPISDIAIEINKFAFMKMKNGECKGSDFQNGRLRGYKDKYEYINERQNNLCCLCNKKPIEHYHHLVHRSQGGSDLPENLIGVCKSCHDKIHNSKLKTKIKGIKKEFHHLSVLNQAIPYITDELENYGYECRIFTGKETSDYRKKHKIGKDHDKDAACIAAMAYNIQKISFSDNRYTIQQFRNHNRKRIHAQYERSYYSNSICIAKNRKDRCEQKGDSLQSWFQKNNKFINFIPDIKQRFNKYRDVNKNFVCKSVRQYNNMDRYRLGTIFIYNKENKKHKTKHILSSIQSVTDFHSIYTGKKTYNKDDCSIIAKNDGLVYI